MAREKRVDKMRGKIFSFAYWIRKQSAGGRGEIWKLRGVRGAAQRGSWPLGEEKGLKYTGLWANFERYMKVKLQRKFCEQ